MLKLCVLYAEKCILQYKISSLVDVSTTFINVFTVISNPNIY